MLFWNNCCDGYFVMGTRPISALLRHAYCIHRTLNDGYHRRGILHQDLYDWKTDDIICGQSQTPS